MVSITIVILLVYEEFEDTNVAIRNQIFVLFNSYMTGVTSGEGTVNPSGSTRVHPCFLVDRVALCSTLCVHCFADCCLLFFDLVFQMVPLVYIQNFLIEDLYLPTIFIYCHESQIFTRYLISKWQR